MVILLETNSIIGRGVPYAFLGSGGNFLILFDLLQSLRQVIILSMRGSARDDKNLSVSISSQNRGDDDFEKDRKIKRLTQINRELIETLKQQNEELTKKISKQKIKSSRSTAKSTPKNGKQLQSIRKELSNAYKQIDMYKETIQNLKSKEVSLDNVDKIYELENKVKLEDAAIENYQKELKYLAAMKEKQEKQLKLCENDEVKQTKANLEKEISDLKEKQKLLKKNAVKRDEIQKRQHAYYVQLEKALRKANDEYYPGKVEHKEIKEEDAEISEKEWQTVKNKLAELRRGYQQNNKKLDLINRQKIRQLKSYEENQLKLKEKMRKLNTLKSRVLELSKLTIIKQSKEQKPSEPLPKKQEIVKNDKNRVVSDRQVKKWNVPEGFCLQKGKVLPNSTFTSDKSVLSNQHKFKIVEVNAWTDGVGIPCLLKFIYQSEEQQLFEGKDMIESIPSNLQMSTFKLKDKDYIWHISGKFSHGLLISLTLKSKLGKEITFQDESSTDQGDTFSFNSKPNDIPSCFFGATLRPSDNEVRICYLGCEFMSDW